MVVLVPVLFQYSSAVSSSIINWFKRGCVRAWGDAVL